MLMPTTEFWVWWPLAVLVTLASYAAAPALTETWLAGAPLGSAFLVAAAVHTVWVVSCIRRRHVFLRSVAWILCLNLAQDGLARLGARQNVITGLGLEAVLMLAAFAASPSLDFSERLGSWRRARETVMAQLILTDGVLPWFIQFFRRLLGNRPDPSITVARLDRAQMLAEIEDAEMLSAERRRRLT
jgi:hypothetical protein